MNFDPPTLGEIPRGSSWVPWVRWVHSQNGISFRMMDFLGSVMKFAIHVVKPRRSAASIRADERATPQVDEALRESREVWQGRDCRLDYNRRVQARGMQVI